MISPLLSNCYLHLLDRIWDRHQLCWKLKARIVRYADDFVVLCGGEVDAPLATVRRVLDRLELTLNETKTRIIDARKVTTQVHGMPRAIDCAWTNFQILIA